jgi:polyisoprenoid-binding protein YceI
MARYTVGAGSKLVVMARSSVHDTTTTWSRVSGSVEADPQTLAQAGATATFTVDMTEFDAGDWLKNRKLRKDFDLDAHPQATFRLTGLRDVVRAGDGFTATADGVLQWRGREVPLVIAGRGALDDTTLTATGRFDLDIRRLGLAAPKILMFKVADEVSIEVTLRGEVRR